MLVEVHLNVAHPEFEVQKRGQNQAIYYYLHPYGAVWRQQCLTIDDIDTKDVVIDIFPKITQ